LLLLLPLPPQITGAADVSMVEPVLQLLNTLELQVQYEGTCCMEN